MGRQQGCFLFFGFSYFLLHHCQMIMSVLVGNMELESINDTGDEEVNKSLYPQSHVLKLDVVKGTAHTANM